MNTRRNTFSLLLVSVLALALGACDSSGGVTSPINVGGSSSSGGSGSSSSGGGANSAPSAKNDLALVQAGSSNNPLNVLANDTDADGDVLVITGAQLLGFSVGGVPGAPRGVLSIAPDAHSLRYTPAAGTVGIETLRYTISDGRGGSSQAIATVTTSPLAVPPAALPDVFTLTSNHAQTLLDVLANDIDGAGGGLVLTAASSTLTVPPSNAGNVVAVSNGIRYTPKPGFTGVETLSYTIRDANGATATAVVVITVLPLAPPPVAIADVLATTANTVQSIDVLANDVDLAGGGLSLVSVAAIASVPVGSNGSFSISNGLVRYTPPNATFVGVQTAQYSVRDSNGSSAIGLITVVVSPIALSLPPVALPDVAIASAGTPALIDALANDIDASATGLSISAASLVLALPANPAISITINSGKLSVSAPAGYAGVVTGSYTARDGNGATSTAAVIVTFTPAPLPPVALPDLASVVQDSAATSIDVLVNDLDLSGSGLSLTAASVVTALPPSAPSLSISGNRLSFTPEAGFSGVVSIRYTATDGLGGSGEGLLTVIVTPLALSPGPLALPDLANLAQDAAATSIDVLANDLDPAGGGLSLSASSVLVSLPTSAGHLLAIVGNQLRFTPAPGFAGVVTVQYTVLDANGASGTGLLGITVSPLAAVLAPVAIPDAATLAQDSPGVDLDVLANDLDIAGGGLALTATSINASLPTSAGHSASIVAGKLHFVPAPGFAGVVSLSYTVTDTNSATATGLVSLVVTPAALSVPPLPLPDLATVSSSAGAVDINVLANDVDPAAGGLTLSSASITLALPASAGSIAIVGNQLRYTPSLLYVGVVTVSYTVTDSQSATGTGVLTLTVLP